MELIVADLVTAQKLEPGNASIEDELARLEWAEKKAAMVFTKYPLLGISLFYLHVLIPKDRTVSRDKLPSQRTKESTGPAALNPIPSQSLEPTPQNPTSSNPQTLRVEQPPPSVAKSTAKPRRLVEELGPTTLQTPSHGPTNQKGPTETVTHPPTKDSSLRMAPPPPSQPYSPQHSSSRGTTPAEITSLASLEKLLRQRPDNMAQTLFNLDAGRLPGLFGQFGFDTSFLNAFLEAIVARRDDEGWVSQTIAILDSLRKCGRFSIALTFAPAETVRHVFEVVEGSNLTDDEQRQITELKQFWELG
jgi:Potential Monad-binding region of RPAP3